MSLSHIETHIAETRKPRSIMVLFVPPIEELDLVGPVQVLSTATRLMDGSGTRYEILVVSTTRDRVMADESDLCLMARSRYGELQGAILYSW